MKPRTDLTGMIFGRLTVVSFSGVKENGKYRYAWSCICGCGQPKEVTTQHLRSGAITNCGCVRRTRNGASSHPLFPVWANMVSRCTDPSNKSYANYGGRGIRVSPEWMDPEVFIRDMGTRPSGFTLERSDNDGPYSKCNCVWADRITQANNKRNIPKIAHNGQSRSVADWAREFGIPAETLRSRLKDGVPLPAAALPRQWTRRPTTVKGATA